MLATAITGAGPGGMGPLLWAAQNGELGDWLAQGIAVVDRRAQFGGSLGRFAINSDSLGGAYLECLEAAALPPELRRLRAETVVKELERHRSGFPPLELVDRYLKRLGAGLHAMIDVTPGCAFHGNSQARALHLQPDGTLRLDLIGGDGRQRSLYAQTAIVALGGRQIWRERPVIGDFRLGQLAGQRTMPSDRVLSRIGLAEAAAILAASPGRPVLILGGSHSAYSVAWTLCSLLPADVLGPRRIAIVQRKEPKVFYANCEAAIADNYSFQPGDICPRTNRINRLGGLRGDGREIWRMVTGRAPNSFDARLVVQSLHDVSRGQLQRMLEEAALVVPAFGYCSRTLPVFDQYGQRLTLQAEAGGDAVDPQCRIVLQDGRSLANVFGIGLGTGFRPRGEMGGEPNFAGQANSLWLYQNGIGAVIHRAIQLSLGNTGRRQQTISRAPLAARASGPQPVST